MTMIRNFALVALALWLGVVLGLAIAARNLTRVVTNAFG